MDKIDHDAIETVTYANIVLWINFHEEFYWMLFFFHMLLQHLEQRKAERLIGDLENPVALALENLYIILIDSFWLEKDGVSKPN